MKNFVEQLPGMDVVDAEWLLIPAGNQEIPKTLEPSSWDSSWGFSDINHFSCPVERRNGTVILVVDNVLPIHDNAVHIGLTWSLENGLLKYQKPPMKTQKT